MPGISVDSLSFEQSPQLLLLHLKGNYKVGARTSFSTRRREKVLFCFRIFDSEIFMRSNTPLLICQQIHYCSITFVGSSEVCNDLASASPLNQLQFGPILGSAIHDKCIVLWMKTTHGCHLTCQDLDSVISHIILNEHK